MKVEVTTVGEAIVNIALEGRLDIHGAERAELPLAAGLSGTTHVVIDLSGVTFLASIGLRTLLTNARAVQRRGGRVALYNAGPDVERVLRMSGIDTMIPIVPDFDAACRLVRR